MLRKYYECNALKTINDTICERKVYFKTEQKHGQAKEHDKEGVRYYKSLFECGRYVWKVLLLAHPELQPSQKHQVPDRVQLVEQVRQALNDEEEQVPHE